LRYLPPYSPDMNPIEKAFSKLKAYLRKIAERTVAGLMRALEACADIFKSAECTNYFAACGYDTSWSESALTSALLGATVIVGDNRALAADMLRNDAWTVDGDVEADGGGSESQDWIGWARAGEVNRPIKWGFVSMTGGSNSSGGTDSGERSGSGVSGLNGNVDGSMSETCRF
jgi:hypothetical protein